MKSFARAAIIAVTFWPTLSIAADDTKWVQLQERATKILWKEFLQEDIPDLLHQDLQLKLEAAEQLIDNGYLQWQPDEQDGRIASASGSSGGGLLVFDESDDSTVVGTAGFTDSYTVALAAPPTAEVNIDIRSGTQLKVTPVVLRFDADNWDSPQTVAVHADADRQSKGRHAISMRHIVESTDPNYRSTDPYLMVEVLDRLSIRFALTKTMVKVTEEYRFEAHGLLAGLPFISNAVRKQHIGPIHKIFRDEEAPAKRVWALRGIATLGQRSPPADIVAELKQISEITDLWDPTTERMKMYAMWALARSEHEVPDDGTGGEALSYRYGLAAMMIAADPDIRPIASRAVMKLESAGSRTRNRIGKIMEGPYQGEPYEAALFACLYVHAEDEVSREGLKNSVLGYVQSGDPEHRRDACTALGIAGNAGDVELIEPLLEDPDSHVRVQAAGALIRIARRQLRPTGKLDMAIIGIFVVVLLGVGVLCWRRCRDSDEYLLGGRQMGWSVVGLSLLVSLLTVKGFASMPVEVMKHGPMILGGLIGVPIVYLLIGYAVLPVFMRQPVTSAYELLETRLGVIGRLAGASMFCLLRFVWMALIIYGGARLLLPMLGLPEHAWVHVCIVLGLVAVAYAFFGGLRAVVITGVIQWIVLVAGAAAVIVSVQRAIGSSWVPVKWAEHWESRTWFSMEPDDAPTLAWSILSLIAVWLFIAGADQIAVQRFQSTRDLNRARRALAMTLFAHVLVMVLLGMVGVAVGTYFLEQPHLLPDGRGVLRSGDVLLPHLSSHLLGAGLGGLVVCALVGVVLSSVASGLHSSCAVIATDYIDRFRNAEPSGKVRLNTARLVCAALGVVVVLLSLLMGWIRNGDRLFEMLNAAINLLAMPLVALFLLAFFVRFANGFGAIWGAIYGFAFAFIFTFWHRLTNQPDVVLNMDWVAPLSLVVAVMAGIVVSLLPSRPRAGAAMIEQVELGRITDPMIKDLLVQLESRIESDRETLGTVLRLVLGFLVALPLAGVAAWIWFCVRV